MSNETNKKVVRRYFEEALDPGNPDILEELFADNCVIYRPGLEPLHGLEMISLIVTAAHEIYIKFKTTIHEMIAEGDFVAVRLTHNAVYRGVWNTPVGAFDCTDKKTNWQAMVMFKLDNAKIIEERVMRDELGMLLDVGALTP